MRNRPACKSLFALSSTPMPMNIHKNAHIHTCALNHAHLSGVIKLARASSSSKLSSLPTSPSTLNRGRRVRHSCCHSAHASCEPTVAQHGACIEVSVYACVCMCVCVCVCWCAHVCLRAHKCECVHNESMSAWMHNACVQHVAQLLPLSPRLQRANASVCVPACLRAHVF